MSRACCPGHPARRARRRGGGRPPGAGGRRGRHRGGRRGGVLPGRPADPRALPGHPRAPLRARAPRWPAGSGPHPSGSGCAVGDRVAAFPFLGGFAEVVEADPAMVFPLPDSVTYEQGAALPMNYLTCHFALRERAGLAVGETVLVHGAAGGIGTAAVQLAAAWDARVIAVVSSQDKVEVARTAGAQEVVLAEGFREAVRG